MISLFAAIAIPPEIGELLAERQLFVENARWRDLEALHITLRYFGPIQENVAADLAIELENARNGPFELRIEGAGCFGEGDRIRAIWAGVGPSDPLQRLAARCETAARRSGLPPDGRNYLPHVTLAYLKRPDEQEVAAWIGRNNLLKTPSFPVERFGLYSSWPSEHGSRYELERFYRLVG